ncbi:MFS general substrate transporter [Gymnopus androsaceus JB14]|uniref:MFS general substrate transporter n=1 Tax=Gymnopus androsaceus JB14 TaxID=1447944 RepID=A0A6A4H9W2_9AGAR|nr:MFS general substrate transporter [Gymnopus androsaceus JB14]
MKQSNTAELTSTKDGDYIIISWPEGDPENPMNWDKTKKWTTTMLLCLMCLFIGLSTAGYSAGIAKMTEELGVSVEAGEVGMFVFNASFAIVPMFLGPLSEFLGRNLVYLGCYAMFCIWFIPIALAKNIGTVIVCRFLSGCFGAAGTTIIPGTLVDIWTTEERGTVSAPLYNGYIDQNLGWRWIEWIQLIANGALFACELLLLRETRGSLLLARRAKKMRKETGDQRYRAPSELEAVSIKDLLHASTTRAALLLVREPVVFFFSLWLAFAWAMVFLFFSVISLTFVGNHGFSEGAGGLPYISCIIGTFFGLGACFHQKYLYDSATRKNNGVPVPEARLYWSTVGAVLLPISLFWFSWTQFSSVPWIVPCIYMIFDAVQNYLADGYGEYASSAISAQGFVRNMLAASFPLFSRQMFDNMKYQWAGTMLALIATVMVPLPFILIKYGGSIREKSPYAAATTNLEATSEKKKTLDVESTPASSECSRVN